MGQGARVDSSSSRQPCSCPLPCAAQVPSRLISPIRVAEPLGERVPPLILRAITAGRRLRSARLLVAGTAGSITNPSADGLEDALRQYALGRVGVRGIGSRQLGCQLLEVPPLFAAHPTVRGQFQTS